MTSVTQKYNIVYSQYKSEDQLKELTDLIDIELSEPYSVFTYRYFVNTYPELCFLVHDADTKKCIGGVMSRIDTNKNNRTRGYIGMLVVDSTYRGQKIGSTLVRLTLKSMYEKGVDIALLETEACNTIALSLYESIGFARSKLLPRFYMNNSDAYRLKFWLTPTTVLQLFNAEQEAAQHDQDGDQQDHE